VAVWFFWMPLPAVAEGAGPVQPFKVDLTLFECVNPPEAHCTAVDDSAKAKCQAGRQWETRRLAYRAVPEFRSKSTAYREKANFFLRDAVESIYGVKYPTTAEGLPVRVHDLYHRPSDYELIDVPATKAGPGTVVVWPSALGGVVVGGGGTDFLPTDDLNIAFPSKHFGGVQTLTLASLRKKLGEPKFLVPRALAKNALPESSLRWKEAVDSIWFESGSARLDAGARTRLELLAGAAKEDPNLAFNLMGSADPTGSAEYNLILSERRAESALDYLTAAGVGRERIRTASQGMSLPECNPQQAECVGKAGQVKVQKEIPQGEYWNAWAEPLAPEVKSTTGLAKELRYSRLKNLLPHQSYLIALHLAAFPYKEEKSDWLVSSRHASPEFEEGLRLRASAEPWKLRVVVLPGPFFTTVPTVVEDELVIPPDDVLSYPQRAVDPPADPLADLAARKKAGDPLPAYVFGEIAFALTTGDLLGATGVGVSLWDERTNRPIDEILIPLCIATSPDKCPTKTAIPSLAGPGLLGLATDESPEGLPDGSLHIFQMPWKSVVGVFHRKDSTGTSLQERYPSWRISTSPPEFKASLKNLQEDFGNGDDSVRIGGELASLLFPNEQSAQAAERAFLDFLSSRGDKEPFGSSTPARVFVRMVLDEGGQAGRSVVYPLGLLNPRKEPDGFLGFHFKVEAPLPQQTYQPPERCLDNWLLVLPPQTLDAELDRGVEKLKERRTGHATFTIAHTEAPAYADLGTFRDWLTKSADQGGSSEAFAVLSHHDDRKLFFKLAQKAEYLTPETLQSLKKNPFARPSMAILGSCSTLNIGADAIVERLNAAGVETVIATNDTVAGDLAGAFLECLIATVETVGASPITASDLFRRAQRCVWLVPAERDHQPFVSLYGAQVLSFSLVGNPSLTLCAPRQP
jgi:hypothetical protein